MRVLVTGVSGLIGSNLAAAATQQSWEVLGTWHRNPVRLPGRARTARLDMADRQACANLVGGFEPDVVVHAAASVALSRLEHEPYLAQLNHLGAENTLAAAGGVRAHYVLVSSDWIFNGHRPSGQCWDDYDAPEPINAYGRSKLACEQAVQRSTVRWLITRPANVYGVNLAIPEHGSRAEHIWRRSSLALHWVRRLRAGKRLPAPADVYQSPTYAWDYAQRVCELIAQGCEGLYNTAGPDSMHRREYLRTLARAFDCDPELVREGTTADFLRASDEDARLKLPANTALCDQKASFVLGRPAVDPLAGHRLMREQLERVLAHEATPIGENHR
jgi:dTDP-4-dehydrorhamnose reductase